MAARSKSLFIVGALAVVIAAFASYSLYNYLKGQEAQVKKAVAETIATRKVVIAEKEIPVGTPINSAQAGETDWPQNTAPAGSFSLPSEVVGRVALQTFVAGEPIVESKLLPKEGHAGILTYKIPEGHRAMTVAVDQVSGVAGFISPGNVVDVVLTVNPPGHNQPISKIVLQNVHVLATGQIIEQQPDGKPVVVPTVTVDVTPDNAEKLAIASTQGRLQLILRKAGDTEVAMTDGSNVGEVVRMPEREPKPKAVEKVISKKKPEGATVEVIRRAQKTVETFPEDE